MSVPLLIVRLTQSHFAPFFLFPSSPFSPPSVYLAFDNREKRSNVEGEDGEEQVVFVVFLGRSKKKETTKEGEEDGTGDWGGERGALNSL